MTPLLSPEEVDAALARASSPWRRDRRELVLEVTRGDFAGALAFVNAVGALAEEAGHHPDIELRWNKVTLRLSTHAAGGLTRRDLELADRVATLLEQGAA